MELIIIILGFILSIIGLIVENEKNARIVNGTWIASYVLIFLMRYSLVDINMLFVLILLFLFIMFFTIRTLLIRQGENKLLRFCYILLSSWILVMYFSRIMHFPFFWETQIVFYLFILLNIIAFIKFKSFRFFSIINIMPFAFLM